MSRCRRHRKLSAESLEARRCLAASLGWDGPGQGAAELSYHIGNTPPNLAQAAVESAIETALEAWSNVIDVQFTQISQPNQRDSIDFTFGSIDGAGGTLAQAYLPDDLNPPRIAGDVEFDLSESWEIGNALGNSAFDLVHVAVHEIGHALGVDHLDVSGSVMAPFVSPSQQYRGLSSADIDAALQIYAAAPGAATESPVEENPVSPTVDNNTETEDELPDEVDDTADTNTSTTNGNWRRWRRFWWWIRWRRFGENLVAAPASHNAVMPADVNQDGNVTSLDALSVINRLSSPDGGDSSILSDTNADGETTDEEEADDDVIIDDAISPEEFQESTRHRPRRLFRHGFGRFF